MTTTTSPLRIALIGTGFMGRMHTQAWRTAPHFFDLPLAPERVLLVGHRADATAEAVEAKSSPAPRRLIRVASRVSRRR